MNPVSNFINMYSRLRNKHSVMLIKSYSEFLKINVMPRFSNEKKKMLGKFLVVTFNPESIGITFFQYFTVCFQSIEMPKKVFGGFDNILESPHQVDMKNIVKSCKHFFGYFNTLETHSVQLVFKFACIFCSSDSFQKYRIDAQKSLIFFYRLLYTQKKTIMYNTRRPKHSYDY